MARARRRATARSSLAVAGTVFRPFLCHFPLRKYFSLDFPRQSLPTGRLLVIGVAKYLHKLNLKDRCRRMQQVLLESLSCFNGAFSCPGIRSIWS